MYEYWLTGHSNEINTQIDPNFSGGAFADEIGSGIDLDILDKAFKGESKDISTYKGVSGDATNYFISQTGAKSERDLIGKSFIDKFYSSTSTNIRVADDYATRNIEEDDHASIFHFNIKRGTPIARAHGHTDQEITLRRNVKYTIKKIRKEVDEYDDTIYHHFYIDVSKR